MPTFTEYLLQPSTLVALVSFVGVVVSYFTVQRFKLRAWKMSTSFFLAAMFLYTVNKLLSPFLTGQFLILSVELKVSFALLISLGIFNLKQNADHLGA